MENELQITTNEFDEISITTGRLCFISSLSCFHEFKLQFKLK